MDKIKKRYEELKKIIAYHSDKYYNQDAPEISDFEYDMLMVELKNIEKNHPEIVTDDFVDSTLKQILSSGMFNRTEKCSLRLSKPSLLQQLVAFFLFGAGSKILTMLCTWK